MSSIHCRIVSVPELASGDRREMYALFERYYCACSYDRFCADLAEKTHVILLREPHAIAGFSTLLRRRLPAVAPGTFLFSGDTVLRDDLWGGQALQRAFFGFIAGTRLARPFEPLYWMLISKGFKTYLMLSRNFAMSLPRRGRTPGAAERQVYEGFYRWKFGEAFQPASGRILFPAPRGAVRAGVAEPDARARADPDVAYFLERNPGYAQGEELACMARVRLADLALQAAKYFFRRSARR